VTIFDIIASVLFKNKKNCLSSLDEESTFSPYLVNRWASMYSPQLAKEANILNKYLGIFENKLDLYNLFVAYYPKVSPKKIQYFKKIKKTGEEEDQTLALYAKNLELSKREITEYLAFLKK
jgi:hypothetical protein